MYTFLGLFKLPVSLTSSTWKIEGESTGEMWAEKIASEIGKILGFSTHTVDIACVAADDEIVGHYGLDISKLDSGMIYGALCHSFLVEGEESLVEGADMIMEYDFTYNRDILIIQLLEKVPDVVMTDLQKQFVIRLLITRRDYMLREFSHEN